MEATIKEIQEKIYVESAFVEQIISQVERVIVGQHILIERLIMGLLCGGHILLEGVPGLAKTLSVSSLARSIDTGFKRIQFTPDLLPADLIGTMIYDQKTSEFTAKKGPIFTNLLLADEINRAPAKVQSALLEAMQEKQVTIGGTPYPLQEPFIVLATQNPIEQEGTYPLPEAQVDRFMLKVKVDYPDKQEEKLILERMAGKEPVRIESVVKPADILSARNSLNQVYMDDKIKDYILDIVFATRDPASYGIDEIVPYIRFGASPRASIYLAQASRAHAFLSRRGYVTPEDVKSTGKDVLRHRIIVTYEAEAQEVTTDEIIHKIFNAVEVP
ncbi:MAG: AAA family ATPase [Candidatus Glassbacteria bacterium]